jgi:hypothetical protein
MSSVRPTGSHAHQTTQAIIDESQNRQHRVRAHQQFLSQLQFCEPSKTESSQRLLEKHAERSELAELKTVELLERKLKKVNLGLEVAKEVDEMIECAKKVIGV